MQAPDATLTPENWRATVREAINDLPEDIRASVGVVEEEAGPVIVRVAVEPFSDEDGEVRLCNIQLREWTSHREQLLASTRQAESAHGSSFGLDSHLKLAEDLGQADWPILSVEPETGEPSSGLFLGRATVRNLKRAIQLAVLDAMFQGGGVSMVCKDGKDRYIREDESPILDWQFPRRKGE